MWRSEERLAARLARLRLRQFTRNVKEQDLEIRSRIGSLDDFVLTAEVRDALGMFPADCESHGEPLYSKVDEVEMLSGGAVRDTALPKTKLAAVRQGRLIPDPNTRSAAIVFRPPAIHSLESFRDRPTEVFDGKRFLLQALVVHTTDRISRFPHRRKSVDLQKLKDSERRGFLHEAEVQKHIPADRAELLAVFRRVPIEMISRLHFSGNRKEIYYSIPGFPKRTQTRVHDMAAIRDNASQDVHLVSHRTQSRQVLLT